MNRYLSLDFLRGLTIFGMVFCAIIPHGLIPGTEEFVLPAWMYHIQNPPPTHNLDMSVAGIGWVDLVFPIFIFCMGAALPFAGRGKLAKFGAEGFTKIFVKETFERFIMLWLFSYLYVFLDVSNSFFTILGFISLFPIYMVIKKKASYIKWIRLGGLIVSIALIAIGHYLFGEVLSIQRRGIIIFLLAFLYLFGALIWYFTRDNLKLRAGIFGLVLCFTLITQYENWPTLSYANPNIRWWFNIEYIYFLLLLLPATYIGDILYARMKQMDVYKSLDNKSIHIIFPLLGVLVIWLCYAFYMRLYWLNLIVSVSVLFIVWTQIKTSLPQYKEIFLSGAYLLICGLILEPFEGGIKKVPCTVQYCFATCGISIFLLMVSDYICKYIPTSLLVNTFTGAGKNPLMSYIAFSSFIVPFMNVTGLIFIYRYVAPVDIPLLGVLRAAIMVFLTMWLVSQLSKRGIFWKA